MLVQQDKAVPLRQLVKARWGAQAKEDVAGGV